MPRSHRATDVPSYAEVVNAVRDALHHPDPIARAEAAARLTIWGLPVGPRALVIWARVAVDAQPA